MLKKNSTRPCNLCGLAPEITAREGLGVYCLYFGMRIPQDEAEDPRSAFRQSCVANGNHFVWPVKGVNPAELHEWKIAHEDWYLNRKAVKAGMIVGLISLVASAIGIWI